MAEPTRPYGPPSRYALGITILLVVAALFFANVIDVRIAAAISGVITAILLFAGA